MKATLSALTVIAISTFATTSFADLTKFTCSGVISNTDIETNKVTANNANFVMEIDEASRIVKMSAGGDSVTGIMETNSQIKFRGETNVDVRFHTVDADVSSDKTFLEMSGSVYGTEAGLLKLKEVESGTVSCLVEQIKPMAIGAPVPPTSQK
jgi:hypothetical protein